MVRLTDVIHAGYAQLGSGGMRFWGTHQTVEDTRNRSASGLCFVAVVDDMIIGTVTVKPPQPESEVEIYREPSTWCLTQFAVLPELQGHGIGKRLHDAACQAAVDKGAQRLALDTAEPAKHLIAMYQRWGYVVADTCDYRPFTNYPSVVMTRNTT